MIKTKYIFPFLIFSITPISAIENSRIHEICKEAKDYLGCYEYQLDLNIELVIKPKSISNYIYCSSWYLDTEIVEGKECYLGKEKYSLTKKASNFPKYNEKIQINDFGKEYVSEKIHNLNFSLNILREIKTKKIIEYSFYEEAIDCENKNILLREYSRGSNENNLETTNESFMVVPGQFAANNFGPNICKKIN